MLQLVLIYEDIKEVILSEIDCDSKSDDLFFLETECAAEVSEDERHW
jgi:hypothetical protein